MWRSGNYARLTRNPWMPVKGSIKFSFLDIDTLPSLLSTEWF